MLDVIGFVNVIMVNLLRFVLKVGDDDRFWEEYVRIFEIVRKIIDWFRERYVKLLMNYCEMYSMIYIYFEEFLLSYFNIIGIFGFFEVVVVYFNEFDLWKEGLRVEWMKVVKLMKRMVEFVVEKVREWMRESGIFWNVEEVFGESVVVKFVIKDLCEFLELRDYFDDFENLIYLMSIVFYYGLIELVDRIRIEEEV